MATADGSNPANDGSTNLQDLLSPQVQQDIEYSRRYWGQPGRNVQDFFTMFESLEAGIKNKTVIVNTEPNTEEGRQLLSAYRRLGLALGMDVGQFKRMVAQSVAPVQEGDPRLRSVQQGLRDREYTAMYWRKYASDSPQEYFVGMRDAIHEGEKTNTLMRLIYAPTGNNPDEKSKAMLSARRVLARSFGYLVGSYDIHGQSGTAIAPLKK